MVVHVVQGAGAVVLAAVLFMIGAIAVRAHRTGGLRIAFYGDAILYKRTCARCTGGVQLRDAQGRWGPVPERIRAGVLRDERGQYAGLPQSDTRGCPSCNGMGFYLDAADHVRLPPARLPAQVHQR